MGGGPGWFQGSGSQRQSLTWRQEKKKNVEERPRWPIQSPNKGRKKKAKAKRRERSDQVYLSWMNNNI